MARIVHAYGTALHLDLATCWGLDPQYRSVDWWRALFSDIAADAALNERWPNGRMKYGLRWLARKDNFVGVVEELLSGAEV